MPAEPLRKLIEEVAPGRSVRQLCADAGVPENRLGHWLKPGTQLVRMPTMWQIRDIARILGCRNKQVYRAFRAAVDGAGMLDDDLPDDEQAMLVAYRRLDAGAQRKALQIVELLSAE
ncbi:MAG: hypothetical protein ACRDI2_26190 [Chloroflexota bacterium]